MAHLRVKHILWCFGSAVRRSLDVFALLLVLTSVADGQRSPLIGHSKNSAVALCVRDRIHVPLREYGLLHLVNTATWSLMPRGSVRHATADTSGAFIWPHAGVDAMTCSDPRRAMGCTLPGIKLTQMGCCVFRHGVCIVSGGDKQRILRFHGADHDLPAVAAQPNVLAVNVANFW